MTEYKQLTSGGTDSSETIASSYAAYSIALLGSPDGMFTAGTCMVDRTLA